MDEIKIALLGFDSLTVKPTNDHVVATNVRMINRSNNNVPDNIAKQEQSKVVPVYYSYNNNNNAINTTTTSSNSNYQLYTFEKEALTTVKCLGDFYKHLANFAHRADLGCVSGVYTTALGCAIHTLLKMYRDEVHNTNLPSEVFVLSNKYKFTFSLLAKIIKFLPLHSTAKEDKRTWPRELLLNLLITRSSEEEEEEEQQTFLEIDHAQFFDLLQRFSTHQEIPRLFRTIVGGSVWRSLLYQIAHYVSNGVVLESASEFFIKRKETESLSTESNNNNNNNNDTNNANKKENVKECNSTEEFILELSWLPHNIRQALVQHIYNAGREHCAVLACSEYKQNDTSNKTINYTNYTTIMSTRNHNFSNSVNNNDVDDINKGNNTNTHKKEKEEEDKVDDDVNDTDMSLMVFNAIYNNTLIQCGELNVHELETRILAARELWSQLLWRKIGSGVTVVQEMSTMHEMLLCRRGDIWHTVMEYIFTPLLNAFTIITSAESNETSFHVSSKNLFSTNDNNDYNNDDDDALSKIHTSTNRMNDDNEKLKLTHRIRAMQRVIRDALKRAIEVCDGFDSDTYRAFSLEYESNNHHHNSNKKKNNSDNIKNNDDHNNNNEENTNTHVNECKGVSRETIEGIAQSILEVLEETMVQVNFTYALQLIISASALKYYKQLFHLLFSVRFALYSLHQTQRIFVQGIVTNKQPSKDLRRAYVLYQTMHFLLNSFDSFLQVDVIHADMDKYVAQMKESRTVSEAQEWHNKLVWSLAESSFMLPEHVEIRNAIQCLLRCAITLHVACTRYRLNYWAVANVNETPIEVLAVLRALETRLRYNVVETLFTHFGHGAKNELERAFWVRVDFNRFIGEQLCTSTQPSMTHGAASYSYEMLFSSNNDNNNNNNNTNINAIAAPSSQALRPARTHQTENVTDVNMNRNNINYLHPRYNNDSSSNNNNNNNNNIGRMLNAAVDTRVGVSTPHLTQQSPLLVSPHASSGTGTNNITTNSMLFERSNRPVLLSPSYAPAAASASASTPLTNIVGSRGHDSTSTTPITSSTPAIVTPRHGKVVAKRSASQGVVSRNSELTPISELVSTIVAGPSNHKHTKTEPLSSSSPTLFAPQAQSRRLSLLHNDAHISSLPPRRTHSTLTNRSRKKAS